MHLAIIEPAITLLIALDIHDLKLLSYQTCKPMKLVIIHNMPSVAFVHLYGTHDHITHH